MIENDVLPPWETKCWGSVWHCFASEDVAVSHLRLTAGWRCSRHSHRHRTNHFYLLGGRVAVEEWRWGPDVDPLVTKLGPGECLAVDVDVVHRFTVLESGEMVEVYRPAYNSVAVRMDDIDRLDEGGPAGFIP